MDNQTDYILLLADLEGSTDLPPARASAAMDILGATLRKANETYADALIHPLEINYGDEFGGLFCAAAPVYAAIADVREALRGHVGFRFAAARGRIGHPADHLREMGGPVFKLANDALNELKGAGQFGDWTIAHPLENRTLSVLTNMIHTLIDEMTDYQYEAFRLFAEGHPQTEIARQLNKQEQSVSKTLQRGRARLTLQTEALLRDHLEAHDQSISVDNTKAVEND